MGKTSPTATAATTAATTTTASVPAATAAAAEHPVSGLSAASKDDFRQRVVYRSSVRTQLSLVKSVLPVSATATPTATTVTAAITILLRTAGRDNRDFLCSRGSTSSTVREIEGLVYVFLSALRSAISSPSSMPEASMPWGGRGDSCA